MPRTNRRSQRTSGAALVLLFLGIGALSGAVLHPVLSLLRNNTPAALATSTPSVALSTLVLSFGFLAVGIVAVFLGLTLAIARLT